jgi:hypothetical protein
MSEVEKKESEIASLAPEETVEVAFAVEKIPDDDKLFYRIHKTSLKQGGGIIPGAIKMIGDGKERGMSTNWSKYSDAEALKSVAKKPEDNGVISFIASIVRSTKDAIVEHDPKVYNRSHSHILWDDANETKVRLKLSNSDYYSWEILYV